MAININTLNGGNITITSGSSAPATHEETWYKYEGDTEWRTININGTIAITDDVGSTNQIPNPYDIVAIEIGTNTNIIETYGFCNCYNLSYLVIPETIEEIRASAFIGCDNLTEVTVNMSKQKFEEVINLPCFGYNRNDEFFRVTIHCTD